VHGDSGDFDLVCSPLERHRVDTLAHFAAESHVDRPIAGPDLFLAMNAIGTHALLKAARQVWLEGRRVDRARARAGAAQQAA
jgi:dTDP-glucose 4,6-dehydratase